MLPEILVRCCNKMGHYSVHHLVFSLKRDGCKSYIFHQEDVTFFRENDMIEITNRQAEILAVLINNKEEILGKYVGLSPKGMEKVGINRGTFRKNKEFLLSNHLITLVLKEGHGDQIWEFFDATVLGFIILYQNMFGGLVSKLRINKSSIEKFFPVIYRNWSEFEEIFKNDREGYRTFDFLEIAVKQLSIEFQRDFWNSPYLGKGKHPPLLVRTRLDFGEFEMSLKSEFHFLKRMFKFPKKFPIQQKFDDRDMFMKNLSEKITILFFFYMFQREASFKFEDGVISLPLFSKSDEGKKLRMDYRNQINRIMSIIKKDDELRRIFVNFLKITFPKIHREPIISFLSKRIKGKPYFVLWDR